MLDPAFADLYSRIDSLSAEQIDGLPIGAIQLSPSGQVLSFNAFEAELTGLDVKRVVGKNFFADVAPCTDVREFRGRFTEGVAAKKLHEQFRYRFLLKNRPHRDVLVSLYFDARRDTCWVFVKPIA